MFFFGVKACPCKIEEYPMGRLTSSVNILISFKMTQNDKSAIFIICLSDEAKEIFILEVGLTETNGRKSVTNNSSSLVNMKNSSIISEKRCSYCCQIFVWNSRLRIPICSKNNNRRARLSLHGILKCKKHDIAHQVGWFWHEICFMFLTTKRSVIEIHEFLHVEANPDNLLGHLRGQHFETCLHVKDQISVYQHFYDHENTPDTHVCQ